ncbi:hypothetical protein GCM10010103_29590 [Streptomyces paradoxus]|uniref:Uncharacterized protein n=1 Tax=Streptomyces paradoxus TaxID=66375 RepID=A0A7W9TBG4_9ACTN|nr:hypothetical protein [Streptomyces paradoxus]
MAWGTTRPAQSVVDATADAFGRMRSLAVDSARPGPATRRTGRRRGVQDSDLVLATRSRPPRQTHMRDTFRS